MKLIHLNPPSFSTEIIPPFRFAIVEQGCIFRSGYPKPKNFSFLARLKLKTILSLTPTPPDEKLLEFCRVNDITSIHVPADRYKDHVPLTTSTVNQTLQHLIIPERYPILIHCLDGANNTGMIVMCLRKLELWALHIAMSEFSRYTRDGLISAEETEYLERFGANNTTSNVLVAITTNEAVREDFSLSLLTPSQPMDLELPEVLPRWLWTGSIPSSFLKSVNPQPVAPSSGAASSSVATPQTGNSTVTLNSSIFQVSYAHPCLRCKLKATHIRSLLQGSLAFMKQPVEKLATTLRNKHEKLVEVDEEMLQQVQTEEFSMTLQALDLEGFVQ